MRVVVLCVGWCVVCVVCVVRDVVDVMCVVCDCGMRMYEYGYEMNEIWSMYA